MEMLMEAGFCLYIAYIFGVVILATLALPLALGMLVGSIIGMLNIGA